jgi:hypothetical protein
MCDRESIIQYERIRSFAISMILEAFVQSKRDNVEARTIIKATITEIFVAILEMESYSDPHLRIGVESIIEGVLIRKQNAIENLQRQADFLQAKINYERRKLHEDRQLVIEALQEVSETQSDSIQQIVRTVLENTDL